MMAQGTGHRAQGTGHRAQGTEQGAQSLVCMAQGSSRGRRAGNGGIGMGFAVGY